MSEEESSAGASTAMELTLGTTFQNISSKPAMQFEALRYNFKPASVLGRPGTVWKHTDRSSGEAKKLITELVPQPEADGTKPGKTHKYVGNVEKKETDCVLIVRDGKATLEKLSSYTLLKQLSGADTKLPESRPPPLPEAIRKRHYSAINEEASTPAVGGFANSGSSDEDSSDDSSSSAGSHFRPSLQAAKSIPSPVMDRKSPPVAVGGGGGGPVGGGGKGLFGGGKGLLGGGKGLLTKDGPVQPPVQSSDDDDDSDSSDEDSD